MTWIRKCRFAWHFMRQTLIVQGVAAGSAILLLAACAHDNQPGPITQPAAKAPDPRLCADIEDPPELAGGIVQPVTQAQRDAVQAFLNGELDLWAWGKRGWGRAALAKDAYCK